MDRVAALAALFALVACGDPGPEATPAPEPDVIEDVAVEEDTPTPEPDTTADIPEPDPEPTPPDEVIDHVRATLTDGTEVEGQRIAQYDHRIWWWDAADKDTTAIFDARRFALWPDDRSIRILTTPEPTQIVRAAPPERFESYRDFMRRRLILFRQSPLQTPAYIITAGERYHLEESGFGDFAWDLVLTDAEGRRYKNTGANNDDHYVWGAEVVLPVRGQVIEVIRDAPDNTPGSYEDGAVNNLVGISIDGSYYLYLLHFRQNDIYDHVVVGALLDQGTPLGRVGNSGVTLEPHLHAVLLWYDANADPPRSWSVPVEFENLHTATEPEGPSTLEHFSAPPSDLWINSEPF